MYLGPLRRSLVLRLMEPLYGLLGLSSVVGCWKSSVADRLKNRNNARRFWTGAEEVGRDGGPAGTVVTSPTKRSSVKSQPLLCGFRRFFGAISISSISWLSYCSVQNCLVKIVFQASNISVT